MKKVVYSLTRFRKYENQVRKGIGYITDEDLIITVFKNGISLILQRFFTPKDFILGDIARHKAFVPLLSSATTRQVSKGLRPRSAHSTEA